MEDVRRWPAKWNCRAIYVEPPSPRGEPIKNQWSRKVWMHPEEGQTLESNCLEGQQSPRDARMTDSRGKAKQEEAKKGTGQPSRRIGRWRNDNGAEAEKIKVRKQIGGDTTYCLFALKPLFKFVLGFLVRKTPRIDLKSCQRHRNDVSVYRLALIYHSKTKKY